MLTQATSVIKEPKVLSNGRVNKHFVKHFIKHTTNTIPTALSQTGSRGIEGIIFVAEERAVVGQKYSASWRVTRVVWKKNGVLKTMLESKTLKSSTIRRSTKNWWEDLNS